MAYNKGQIEKLIGKLTHEELKSLCMDKFPGVYGDFDGQPRSDRNRALTDYVFSHGMVNDLVGMIKSINKHAHDRVMNPVSYYGIHSFDLTSSIEHCYSKIDNEKSLIFLSLSCSTDELFMNIFCERLKEKIEYPIYDKKFKINKEVHKADPQTVSIKLGSTITRISKNIRYEPRLKDNNIIIFPVDISGCSEMKDIFRFVDEIQKSFENRTDFCSVVIMFRKDDFSYPRNVIRLDNIILIKKDLKDWIDILIEAVVGNYDKKECAEEWKRTGKLWLDIIIERLSSKEDNIIAIDEIYCHLKIMFEQIKLIPRISPQQFLKEVEEDLKELTEKKEYSHV